MKKTRWLIVLAAAAVMAGCGQKNKDTGAGQDISQVQGDEQPLGANQNQATGTSVRDNVIVVMGPTSEPEAGFDPA